MGVPSRFTAGHPAQPARGHRHVVNDPDGPHADPDDRWECAGLGREHRRLDALEFQPQLNIRPRNGLTPEGITYPLSGRVASLLERERDVSDWVEAREKLLDLSAQRI